MSELKTIILDGVKYVEVREGIKVGDIVKIIGNSNNHRFEIGEKVRVKEICPDGNLNAEHLDGSDYWYVKPDDIKTTANEVTGDEQTESTNVIIITELNGTTHEIESDNDVDDFVTYYGDNGSISHADVYIPKNNIASITKAVR